MFSPEVIADLSRQAAVRAAARGLEPYAPANADEVLKWPIKLSFIPNIGDYRPDGWRLADYVTCDATGRGGAWEPALNHPQLLEWVHERRLADPTAGFACVETGQFQFVLGYFTRNPEINPEFDDFNGIKDLTFDECPNCGEPIETVEGSFKDDTCPHCDRRIQGEVSTEVEVCPECFNESTIYVDGGELECGTCGHTWDYLLFEAGDEVDVADPEAGDMWFHGFRGTVERDVAFDEDVVSVRDQAGGLWDVDIEKVKKHLNSIPVGQYHLF